MIMWINKYQPEDASILFKLEENQRIHQKILNSIVFN